MVGGNVAEEFCPEVFFMIRGEDVFFGKSCDPGIFTQFIFELSGGPS